MKVLIVSIITLAALYIVFILGLIVAGKKVAARALAGIIPDCVVLFKNLLKDRQVPARYKLLLGILLGYLISPLDLVPEFIPIVGQLDDAIVVALVLRVIIKGTDTQTVKRNWKGPESSLKFIFKLARIDYS